MDGIGNSYSFWKSKLTIGIFLVLAFLQVGPRFVDIPSAVTLITLPVSMVHGMTLGRVLAMIPVNIPFMSTAGVLVTTYIFSAIIGYFVHQLSGNSM